MRELINIFVLNNASEIVIFGDTHKS